MNKPSHFVALGDTHGDFAQILKISRRYPDTPIRHLGDVGLGFPYQKKVKGIWISDPKRKDPESFPDNVLFCRGNHDSPSVCRSHPNYLGDYGIDPLTGIFFVSGGESTDRDSRIEGRDWWRDEELHYTELHRAVGLYEEKRPRIVISHECPSSIIPLIRSHHRMTSRTSQCLQAMLDIHRPDLWVFGHHHVTWQKKRNGSLFACAAINQPLKFPI